MALPLDGDLCRCPSEGLIAPHLRIGIGRELFGFGVEHPAKDLTCPWASQPIFLLTAKPLSLCFESGIVPPPPTVPISERMRKRHELAFRLGFMPALGATSSERFAGCTLAACVGGGTLAIGSLPLVCWYAYTTRGCRTVRTLSNAQLWPIFYWYADCILDLCLHVGRISMMIFLTSFLYASASFWMLMGVFVDLQVDASVFPLGGTSSMCKRHPSVFGRERWRARSG